MRARRLLQISILGVCLGGSAVTAGEIYKWTGADGVTHYSESAPALPGGGVETLQLVPGGAPAQPAAGYQSALEVARDIESGRLQRERLRLERQKLRFEQAQAAAREQREEAQDRRYYPLYPYYYRYPHKLGLRPGHYPHRAPRQWPGMQPEPGPGGGAQTRVPGMATR